MRRYGLAGFRSTGGTAPDWLVQAGTVAELADRIDVPVEALQATVERWNASAAEGHDPDFRRGKSLHDRW